jgi:hypothetical protein
MHAQMMKKIYKYLMLFFALLGSLSATQTLAAGGLHTGVPQNVHLNAEIVNRGPCFHMSPAIPNIPGNWACLWKDNGLFRESTALLISALISGAPCTISWRQEDSSGFPIVTLLDCERGS